jgi:hypothetical protein
MATGEGQESHRLALRGLRSMGWSGPATDDGLPLRSLADSDDPVDAPLAQRAAGLHATLGPGDAGRRPDPDLAAGEVDRLPYRERYAPHATSALVTGVATAFGGVAAAALLLAVAAVALSLIASSELWLLGGVLAVAALGGAIAMASEALAQRRDRARWLSGIRPYARYEVRARVSKAGELVVQAVGYEPARSKLDCFSFDPVLLAERAFAPDDSVAALEWAADWGAQAEELTTAAARALDSEITESTLAYARAQEAAERRLDAQQTADVINEIQP